MTYARNQRAALSAFIEHGDVPMSSNLAENAIRPLWSAERIGYSVTQSKEPNPAPLCTLYSLVETAKANGIDPYDYLLHVLSLLPYFGKSQAHEKLETLMPWHSEVQQRYNEKPQPETE